jgi:NADPH:quinone reductase-like Zn-dependent oxidoreductase
MNAVVWTGYGSPDVLQLRVVEKPVPGDHELLIRVSATTVPSGDCEMRRMSGSRWYTIIMRAYVGLTAPKRITMLGMEFVGVVEATGQHVTRFGVGDRVFGSTGFLGMGTTAEYIRLSEAPQGGAIVSAPANLTDAEAAAIPIGGLEALHFLQQVGIQRGQRVLINGAAGTVGAYAVQLAKYFGADVTAVDRPDTAVVLQSIGADRIIDYTRSDFTKLGETYDVILDIASTSPLSRSLRSLNPDGRLLIANPHMSHLARSRLGLARHGKRLLIGKSRPNAADLEFLKTLIEAGQLRPVIDRSFPLEQTVAAHRYVESGRKTGNVVITLAQGA